jgi:hypothetical protein
LVFFVFSNRYDRFALDVEKLPFDAAFFFDVQVVGRFRKSSARSDASPTFAPTSFAAPLRKPQARRVPSRRGASEPPRKISRVDSIHFPLFFVLRKSGNA